MAEKLSSTEDSEIRFNEDGEEQMVIKPYCQCDSCVHWTDKPDLTLNNFEYEDSVRPRTSEKNIATRLLKTDANMGKEQKIVAFNYSVLSKFEKQSTYNEVFVNSIIIPSPIKLITEVYFHETIHAALKNLDYKEPRSMQSFIWPMVLRKMNICAINGSKTGKTMAYLPAICTLALNSEIFFELSKHRGPLILILCANSNQCEEIYSITKKMFNFSMHKPKVTFLTYPLIYVSDVDIIITIPGILMYCLKKNMFNLKRLCFLIFEDTSILLKKYSEDIYKIMNITNQMLEHRTCNQKVQFIVTSKQWNTNLKNLLMKLYSTPFICIGNFLEAALYGGINLQIKCLMTENKNAELKNIVENKYRIYKTVLICNNTEIDGVSIFLNENKVETVPVYDNDEDSVMKETIWTLAKTGHYKILICSDYMFDTTLTITNAMLLVHYSFPPSWSRFVRRFSCLAEHFKCPLKKEHENACQSLMLIDETNESKIPRIFHLLQRIERKLPDNLRKYMESLKAKTENNKKSAGIKFCETLKLFGKCSDSLCQFRHMCCDSDIQEHLPKNGVINFKIVEILNIAHFTVNLIDSKDIDGNMQYYDENPNTPLKFAEEEEKKLVDKVEIGKTYTYYDRLRNDFYPCEITNVIHNTTIYIKLLNTGEKVTTNLSNIYFLPENYLKQNSSIVDVRLSNFIPPYKDDNFSTRSIQRIHKILEKAGYRDMILTANVILQLDNTLWVDKVVQYIDVIGTKVIKFNLTKILQDSELVIVSIDQIKNLYKLCDKNSVYLPPLTKQSCKSKNTIRECTHSWAFLNKEEMHEVVFSSGVSPDEFYVRLLKFNEQLINLEKDIQNFMKKELVKTITTVTIGNFYLGRDTNNIINQYNRVQIINTENEKALCFFVDYGDEAVINFSDLRELPNKFITQLPFQAIQCRLFGISPICDDWDDMALNVLYNYLYEPDSTEIFRSLFLKSYGASRLNKHDAYKYDVLLKDGFDDKHILINRLLIDCGIAAEICEMPDFELKIEDDYNYNFDSEEEIEENLIDMLPFNVEEMELVFDNEENIFEFLKLCGENGSQSSQSIKSITAHENRSAKCDKEVCDLMERKLMPVTVDYFTPEVYWSQNNEIIIMKIKLVDVTDYNINVFKRKIFKFQTSLDEKKYKLDFSFFKAVELKKKSLGGQEITIILNKIEKVEWMQLTAGEKRLRNIHYEINENHLEEPKRRFLTIDLTDDECDYDDDDLRGLVYCEESDQGSEFEEDISPDYIY